MDWLDGWNYRKRIIIKGSSGAGTGYQVLLKIGESSDSPNCDFHLEGYSLKFPSDKDDSGDLRFTLDDGITLLPLWVEKVEGTAPNRTVYIWVKVDADLSVDQIICCYFGCSDACNVSNGKDTFDFFDDFDTNTLNNYDYVFGSNTTVAYDSFNKRLVINTGDDRSFRLSPKNFITKNFYLQFKIYPDDAYSYGGTVYILGRYQNDNNTYYARKSAEKYGSSTCSYASPRLYKKVNGSDTLLASLGTNTYLPMDTEATIALAIYENDIKFIVNGIKELSAVDSDILTAGRIAFGADQWIGWLDEVIVRKYVDPEPAFCLSGSSEKMSDFLDSFSDWTYRRKITISGSPGAGSDYQILLKIGENSNSLNYDFHLDGKSMKFPSSKNDSGDLRFISGDGQTLLPFWVEKVEGTAPNRTAYVWVKVTDDLSNDTDIYCYFGNADANNVSNGKDTFDFFDDFDGDSLNINKWIISGSYGNYTVSNSKLQIEVAQPSSDWTGYLITSSIPVNNNTVVKFCADQSVHPSSSTGVSAWNSFTAFAEPQYSWLVRFAGDGGKTNSRENVVDEYEGHGDPPNRLVVNNNDYNNQLLEIELWIGDSNKKAWVNGTLWREEGHSSSFASYYPRIVSGIHANALLPNVINVDYVFVRKYTDSEPVFSFGEEEYIGKALPYWSYRRRITISGSSDAGTGYQVLLKIGEGFGSPNYDFHLDNRSAKFPSQQNDSGDLRFTLSDGITLLPLWVEKVEGTAPNRTAYVWVKVNADLSIDQNIYCYFGNPNAENVSNGEETFEFFDNATYDKSSEYQYVDVFYSGETASLSYDTQNNEYIMQHSSDDNEFLQIKNVYITNCCVKAKFKFLTISNNYQFGFFLAHNGLSQSDDRGYLLRLEAHLPRLSITAENGGISETLLAEKYLDEGVQTNVYYDLEAFHYDNYFAVLLRESNGTLLKIVNVFNSTYNYDKIGLQFAYTSEVEVAFKDLLVRKYVSPEPAFCVAYDIERVYAQIQGTIYDEYGKFLKRSAKVFLFDKDTGKLLGMTTSNSSNGRWSSHVLLLSTTKILCVFVVKDKDKNYAGAELIEV